MIVGRSNVGKSTLYNRLLGRREAITGDEYGLTRDYQSGRCILNDIEFYLTDTAGYNTKKSELNKKINHTIKEQVIKAVVSIIISLIVISIVTLLPKTKEAEISFINTIKIFHF